MYLIINTMRGTISVNLSVPLINVYISWKRYSSPATALYSATDTEYHCLASHLPFTFTEAGGHHKVTTDVVEIPEKLLVVLS
jgi:hypothetical protein